GKDKGMYDAVFKGFEMDDGEICCWINADDKFFPWSFSIVADAVLAGHEWVTGNSAYWDDQGRLFRLGPPWRFPRWLIKAGYFHGRGLGFIQQEGTFFTRRLLNCLTAEQVNEIRAMRLAGDFSLWRHLAEHAPLKVLDTMTGAFRLHQGNMSFLNMDTYYDEVARSGGKSLPRFIKILFRGMMLNWIAWRFNQVKGR
ncbi:hypothetical protein D6779_05640, partial [Candidatus Parcubacteria bacterium]